MNVRSFTLCCLFVTFGCKSTQHKSKLRSDEAASQDQAFFDAVGNYIVEYNSGDRIFGPKKLIVTFIKLALSADGTVDVNLGTTNRFDNIKKQFHLGFNTLELEAMGRRRSDLAAMSSRFYADLAPFMDDIVAKYPKAQYLRSQIALNKEGMDVLAKAWTLNGQDTVSTYNAHDVNRILLLKTGGADGQDIILEVSALLPADSTAVAANNAAAKSKQDLLDKLWAQAKTLPPPTPPGRTSPA